jgi:hypothetical protein
MGQEPEDFWGFHGENLKRDHGDIFVEINSA